MTHTTIHTDSWAALPCAYQPKAMQWYPWPRRSTPTYAAWRPTIKSPLSIKRESLIQHTHIGSLVALPCVACWRPRTSAPPPPPPRPPTESEHRWRTSTRLRAGVQAAREHRGQSYLQRVCCLRSQRALSRAAANTQACRDFHLTRQPYPLWAGVHCAHTAPPRTVMHTTAATECVRGTLPWK